MFDFIEKRIKSESSLNAVFFAYLIAYNKEMEKRVLWKLFKQS
ncbi:hypothetical protein D922_03107 [Enterococcus faecalis 06-MB-DW-09]|nr:hypothetical protein D922_03107 [Enterococcus faecalis 06-MB-DW-09]